MGIECVLRVLLVPSVVGDTVLGCFVCFYFLIFLSDVSFLCPLRLCP